MIYILHITLILFTVTSCSSSIPKTEETINEEEVTQIVQTYMDEQMACWNNGDIPCFMEHYWHSDSLLFIGKNGITKGWQSTLDNYLDGYKDPESMGTLTFNNKIIRLLDKESIQVIGQWSIERDDPSKNISGHYTLIWQQKDGKWVIISDHSS